MASQSAKPKGAKKTRRCYNCLSKRKRQAERSLRSVRARRNKHAANHPDQPHPDTYAKKWLAVTVK